MQTFRGARQCLALPELNEMLKDLSLRGRCHPLYDFAGSVSNLALPLFRADDIAVGTAANVRNRPETEGIIGFFLNSLVMRTDLSGNPSFEELLFRVREVTLGAYAHEEVPFKS